MFTKILIPLIINNNSGGNSGGAKVIDENSEILLKYASKLYNHWDCLIVLLHVYVKTEGNIELQSMSMSNDGNVVMTMSGEVDSSRLLKDAQHLLTAAKIPFAKITLRTVIISTAEQQSVATAIVQAAESLVCDLILLNSSFEKIQTPSTAPLPLPTTTTTTTTTNSATTNSATTIGEWKLDPVSDIVRNLSSVSVMIVRPNSNLNENHVPHKKVLSLVTPLDTDDSFASALAHDGSNKNDVEVLSTAKVAAEFVVVKGCDNAAITFVHVFDATSDVLDNQGVEEATEDAEKLLDQVKRRFIRNIRSIASKLPKDDPNAKHGLDLQTKTLNIDVDYRNDGMTANSVGMTFVKFAHKTNQDIILLTKSNEWQATKFLFGSVNEVILSNVNYPIIIIPFPAGQSSIASSSTTTANTHNIAATTATATDSKTADNVEAGIANETTKSNNNNNNTNNDDVENSSKNNNNRDSSSVSIEKDETNITPDNTPAASLHVEIEKNGK